MNKRKTLIIGFSFAIFVCFVMVGITYAFFTASVGGNREASSTIVETAELKLVFSDTQKIEMNEALPGQAVTKTFSVENKGDVEIEYTIDIVDVLNEFQNGDLVYTLTSTNKGASADRKVLPTSEGTLETATIAPGVTQTYTITILFKETGSNQNLSQGAKFTGKLQINSNGQYTTPQPLANVLFDFDTAQSDANIDFAYTSNGCNTLSTCSAGTVDNQNQVTNGLYYTSDTTKTENGEVVYYYRGAVTNNYLVFGGYCWRIVRTVEDGSVRLRYGGSPTQNGETYTCPQTGTAVNIASSQVYNADYDNKSYVNYKTSDIRTVIENWYRDNIYKNGTNTKVTNLIADTPYCNDMSERASGNYVYFGAYDRLHSSGTNKYNPQYKCANSTYAYTVAKGDLTYPIALLTADEVAYAGGVYNRSNSSYYLNTGEDYWTMSPYNFRGSNVTVFYVNSAVRLYSNDVDDPFAVSPAVSLKPEATVKRGTGLYNDPFVINTD